MEVALSIGGATDFGCLVDLYIGTDGFGVADGPAEKGSWHEWSCELVVATKSAFFWRLCLVNSTVTLNF